MAEAESAPMEEPNAFSKIITLYPFFVLHPFRCRRDVVLIRASFVFYRMKNDRSCGYEMLREYQLFAYFKV